MSRICRQLKNSKNAQALLEKRCSLGLLLAAIRSVVSFVLAVACPVLLTVATLGWTAVAADVAHATNASNTANATGATGDVVEATPKFEPVRPDSEQNIVSDIVADSISESNKSLKDYTPSEEANTQDQQTKQHLDASGQELYQLPTLPLFTEQDVLSFSLPAMPLVKRPSSSASFLTKAEQRFCFFYQSSLVENARLINRQCLSKEHLYTTNLDLDKYIFVLKALALFRGKHELGLTEAEFNEVLHIAKIKKDAEKQLQQFKQDLNSAPAPDKELTKEQDINCLVLRSLSIGMLEHLYVGLPLAQANEIVNLYNGQCAGRLSHAEQLLSQAESLPLVELIQPIMDGALYSLTDYLKPKSYLFPFEGTPEQRQAEILEAQKHLKQLGYFDAPLSGVVDDFTILAMANFENDQGLIQTGQVSFSNLMRLRLYTIGYKPEFLMPELKVESQPH